MTQYDSGYVAECTKTHIVYQRRATNWPYNTTFCGRPMMGRKWTVAEERRPIRDLIGEVTCIQCQKVALLRLDAP